MGDFLHGPELSSAIRNILGEPAARAAVAFWGNGSQDWVTGTGVRVVANLMMGGTNPYALEKVPAEVRQNGALHAKVYIGAEQTVVCSANASINGLALEGSTQAGWIEGGVLCPTTEKIVDWFEDLWDHPGSEITKAHWREAKRLWNLRRSSFLPSLASFGHFDPGAVDLPAFTWVGDEDDWKVDEEALAAAEVLGDLAREAGALGEQEAQHVHPVGVGQRLAEGRQALVLGGLRREAAGSGLAGIAG